MNVMIMAVQKAARGLVRDFGELENLQTSTKGFGNFVTTADHHSESILIAELSKARPEYDIITEERGFIEATTPISKFDKNSGFCWIIDPLDGTTNFCHGIPYFSISVALEHQKEIIAGIVYNPVTDEMFIAEKGKGAFLNRKRIRVSGRKNLSEIIAATGSFFGFRGDEGAGAKLDGICRAIGSIRHFGASSLDLAFVASGRIDAFFEKSIPVWDRAAGAILVSEAGGVVALTGDSIVASNEHIHKKLAAVVGGK
jgi:myo-inositol-1(or 4)-monophosphatase